MDIETAFVKSAMATHEDKSSDIQLPPELWQRIFWQHTEPTELWIEGRKVCASWRREISKVIARKDLEDGNMAQVFYDCDHSGRCWPDPEVEFEMVFDRYDPGDKSRCIFVEKTTDRRQRLEDAFESREDYDTARQDSWKNCVES